MARQFSEVIILDNDGLSIGPSSSTRTTFTSTATAARSQSFPDASGNIVLDAAAQTLTNKTIIAASNNVSANSLKTTGASIDTASAAPPTEGQVLTAGVGGISASWLTPVGIGSESSTGTVQTINDTPTTLETFAVGAGETQYFSSNIAARQAAPSNNSAGYRIQATFKDVAGTATRVPALGTDDKLSFEDDTSWDIEYVVSGSNVLLQVTGVAATTINWKSSSTRVVIP